METSSVITGDALECLKAMEPESIDCCVTSPPYYGLRDYGMVGQLGLEDSPEEYIERLVVIFEEVRRVLKREGTLWVNIGDSYAGSWKGAAAWPDNAMNYKQGTNRGMLGKKVLRGNFPGYKPKDLIGIPWMLAFALRSRGWYLRQDIIWSKTNCMPESVRDRCTKSHEYIFLLSKSRHYYYNAELIKEPAVGCNKRLPTGSKGTFTPNSGRREREGKLSNIEAGGLRNKRSVWEVATSRSKEAHFATFPVKLIQPCILAGCPEGGTVLDPFFGTGTTGVAAKSLGRNFVGIELNPEYVAMATRRLFNENRR